MRLLESILQYPHAIVVAIGAAVLAALSAYTRDQSASALQWALSPFTRRLPWNKARMAPERALASRLSIVDVQLVDAGGKLARYSKTSAYVANVPLRMYREGVTASGDAKGFRTARGRIIRTVREHGFYVSKIDLGLMLEPGEQIVNVYQAKLVESFQESAQDWTQQVSFDTEFLLIQIHFPADRPPLTCQTKIVHGTDEREIANTAQMVDLYGSRSIVWPIPFPRTGHVYKLTWTW